MTAPAVPASRLLPLRLALLAHAIAALGFALWIGLVRLGWALPLPKSSQFVAHGPLMVCGFLGTLITLERAIAAGRRSAYLAPIPERDRDRDDPRGRGLRRAGDAVSRLERGTHGAHGRAVRAAANTVPLRGRGRRRGVGRWQRVVAGRLAVVPGRVLLGRVRRAHDQRRATRTLASDAPDARSHDAICRRYRWHPRSAWR